MQYDVLLCDAYVIYQKSPISAWNRCWILLFNLVTNKLKFCACSVFQDFCHNIANNLLDKPQYMQYKYKWIQILNLAKNKNIC